MKHLIITLSFITGTALAQSGQPKNQTETPAKSERFTSSSDSAAVQKAGAVASENDPIDSLSRRKTDTTEIKVGNTRIIVIGEPKIDRIEKIEKEGKESSDKAEKEEDKGYKVHFDWFNFDFGLLGLQQQGTPFANLNETRIKQNRADLELDRGKSTYFNLRIVEANFPIIKEYVCIRTGVGYEFNNYQFSQDVSLIPKVDTLGIIRESIHFEKNKLLAKYLSVPLLLEFNTNPKKHKRNLHLATGIEIGYLLGGKTKQISKERGKVKFKDDYNLQPFTMDYVVRLGYGSISIFAKATTGFFSSTSQSRLFRSVDFMGNTYPFSFGISTNFGG